MFEPFQDENALALFPNFRLLQPAIGQFAFVRFYNNLACSRGGGANTKRPQLCPHRANLFRPGCALPTRICSRWNWNWPDRVAATAKPIIGRPVVSQASHGSGCHRAARTPNRPNSARIVHIFSAPVAPCQLQRASVAERIGPIASRQLTAKPIIARPVVFSAFSAICVCAVL